MSLKDWYSKATQPIIKKETDKRNLGFKKWFRDLYDDKYLLKEAKINLKNYVNKVNKLKGK